MTLTMHRPAMAPPELGGGAKFLRLAHVRCKADLAFSLVRRPDGFVATETYVGAEDLEADIPSGELEELLAGLGDRLWSELGRNNGHGADWTVCAWPGPVEALVRHGGAGAERLEAWALLVTIPISGPNTGPLAGPNWSPMSGTRVSAVLGVLRTGTEAPGEDEARRLQQVARRLGDYLGAVAEIFGPG